MILCYSTQCYSRVTEDERHAHTRYDFLVHNLRSRKKSSVGHVIAWAKASWTAITDALATGTRAASPCRSGHGARGRKYFSSFIATTAFDVWHDTLLILKGASYIIPYNEKIAWAWNGKMMWIYHSRTAYGMHSVNCSTFLAPICTK